MGLIAERWAAADEVRAATDWINDDDGDAGATTAAGVRVTARTALGLTTVWRCVDLLTSAVSQAPKDIILKIGGQSFPEFTKPSWLVMPNPTDPTYTANDYFAQLCYSILFDGNYFAHVFPHVFDPQVLTVLDPARVKVLPGPLYEVSDATGRVVGTLGPIEMLHGTWIRPPGALRGIAPLEALRRGIGSAIAADDFAGRFFGKGAALSFGVEVPFAMDPVKKADLREQLRARYAGTANSHAIGVLSDGAKFVTGLAPTPEQGQMLETRKFSVEDLCRPYGIPPGMAGSQEPGASSYASAYVYDNQFKERAVLPLATRIESQHNRLVSVPANITDPAASAQFRFNLDGISRVDLKTRYEAYQIGILGGFLRPNEAREKEDKAPLPGGERLYMQSQMVPIDQVGQAPAAPTQRSVEEVETEERRHVELIALASRESQVTVPVTITNPAPINVEGPQVTVHPSPPAEVTVQPPVVNVAPPVVTVEPTAVQVDVHVPPQKAVTKTITRNPKGDLTMTETPDGE